MKCNVVSMSDISSLVSTLDQKRQELARIEIELKQAQRQRLETLAGDMGFQNTDELIVGLAAFASPALTAAIRARDSAREFRSPAGASHAVSRARKSRATVSDETREKLTAELKNGTRRAADIAEMFGVSTSLVNQLKQKLGLTKKRRA
jgi:hypothetical protein